MTDNTEIEQLDENEDYSLLDNYELIKSFDNIRYYIGESSIFDNIKLLSKIHYIDDPLINNIYQSIKSSNDDFFHQFVITIARYDDDNYMYLLDGYHIRRCIKLLQKENKNITFIMKVIDVESYDDIINNYIKLHNTYTNKINQRINDNVQNIINYIKNKFNKGDKNKSVISKSDNPRLPFISLYDLTENLFNTKFLNLLDVSFIDTIINDINNRYKNTIDNYTITQGQLDDLLLTDFYLGVDRSMNWIELADNEARKLIIKD